MKLIGLSLWLLSMQSFADDATSVFDRVHDSVVSVSALNEHGEPDAEGSAVVVGTEQVVTNCHVIADASSIKVKVQSQILSAKLLHADVARDLCSLTVTGLVAPTTKIRRYQDLKIGERVYAIGNPLGFELSVSAGLVSYLGNNGRSEPRIVTTAPLSPGSSGGGLFDSDGRLVGITTAILQYGQNANLALPADWIAELPKRSKPPMTTVTDVPPDPNWFDEAEKLRRSNNKWNELVTLCNDWQKVYPTSADAGTYKGLALFNLNKLADAQDTLEKTTRDHPRNAAARGYLGLVRARLGDTKGAQSDFEAAIALNPGSAFIRLPFAGMLRATGRLDLANKMISEAIRIDPSDARYWAELGDILVQQKNLEKAIQAYQTTLKLDSSFSGTRTNLAAAQAMLGQSGEAKQTLGSSSNPNVDAGTWIKIGIADEEKGRYGEAEKAYRKAAELDPKSTEAWYRLGGCLARTNRSGDAEKAFRTAIVINPNWGSAWWGLGEVLQSRGDKQPAIEAFQKATSLEPKLTVAWRSLAYLLLEKKDFRGAAEVLQKIVELEPNASNDWPLLADALIKLQRMDEARMALERAEQVAPKNILTLQSGATYYGMRGEYLKSLGYTDRALEIDSASANSWSNKGYSLLKLQRYNEAIEAIQTAINLQPDFANAWINLGEANLRAKQLGKAITVLEKACQLVPNAADARLFLAQAYLGSGQPGKAKLHLDLLTQRQPNLAAGWYMLAVVNLAQGSQKDMVIAYTQLKTLQPTLARVFKEKLRGNPTYRDVVLPE